MSNVRNYKCINCGGEDFNRENLQDKLTIPWRDREALLITEPIRIRVCCKCGSYAIFSDDRKKIDEAARRSFHREELTLNPIVKIDNRKKFVSLSKIVEKIEHRLLLEFEDGSRLIFDGKTYFGWYRYPDLFPEPQDFTRVEIDEAGSLVWANYRMPASILQRVCAAQLRGTPHDGYFHGSIKDFPLARGLTVTITKGFDAVADDVKLIKGEKVLLACTMANYYPYEISILEAESEGLEEEDVSDLMHFIVETYRLASYPRCEANRYDRDLRLDERWPKLPLYVEIS